MALSVEVGTKTSPGATGNQAYALPAGFGTPKAVIVWASNQATTGTQTAAGMFSVGVGAYQSGSARGAYSSWLVDPVNTVSRIVYGGGNPGGASITDICGMYDTPESTVEDWHVKLVSFTTDTWTVNWSNIPAVASTFLHYIVLGGTDITDAVIQNYVSTGTPASPVDITSSIGQPDLFFFFGHRGVSAGSLTDDFSPAIGWAVSDTERAALAMGDNDAALTMATASWAKARAGVNLTNGVTAEFEYELSARSAWPSGGYQITYPVLPPASTNVYAVLLLKGSFQKKILESRTTATATGNQDHDVGFVPKLAINWGHVMPSAQTIQRAAANADATMIWHGAHDGTNQAVAGVSQDDGKATSFGRSYAQTAQCLHAAEAVAAATRVQASGSFSGNNVRLNYGTVSATARQFHILALGDAAAAGVLPKPRLVLQAVNRAGTY